MRLGEILIERGKIEAEDLERALELQRERGDKLGKILVDMGLHRPARRAGGAFRSARHPAGDGGQPAALRARNRRPFAPLPAPVPRLPGGAGRFHAHPRHGRSAGFRDHRGRARLLRPGNPARRWPPSRKSSTPSRSTTAKASGRPLCGEGDDEQATADLEHLRDMASEAPVIRLVNAMIAEAIEKRASDIHIEPFEKEFRVRFRVDGVLFNQEPPPRELKAAIISRLKLMAKLNIAERRLPQDGRIKIKILGREVDLRVSTLPTLYGESVVMRLLDRSAGDFYDLRRLGFDDRMLARMEHFTSLPHGIFLVTGPTGSGKSTTLYSALKRINLPDKKIITIEDPVEYQMDGINQIHVNPQIGLTFAAGLRHIVRQDPDVIMVGEIRDRETADIAIRAALTGHLVFSTLHTNDAPSAITRLTDMGVENYLITSSLVAVLAQRLVRVICPHCKRAGGHGAVARRRKHRDVPRRRLRGVQRHAATAARMGIFEMMDLNDEIRKLIMSNADASALTAGRAPQRHAQPARRRLEEDRATASPPCEEVMRVTQEF